MSPRRTINQLLLAVLLSFLAIQHAHAVGIGDISVMSKLGQPLRAEISLLTTSSDDIDSIRARLAPVELYKRTGLEMDKARYLRFKVVKTAAGKVNISITTAKPYNEPTLNFIIHILWDGGSIMKEYNLLLDPA